MYHIVVFLRSPQVLQRLAQFWPVNHVRHCYFLSEKVKVSECPTACQRRFSTSVCGWAGTPPLLSGPRSKFFHRIYKYRFLLRPEEIYLCQNATVRGCRGKNPEPRQVLRFSWCRTEAAFLNWLVGVQEGGRPESPQCVGGAGLDRPSYYKGWRVDKAGLIHLLSMWKTFRDWMIFSPPGFGN